MADRIEKFFQKLEEKGHQPLLAKIHGTVRFDVVNRDGPTDHWLVAVDGGDFTITHEMANADCTIEPIKHFSSG